MAKYDLLVKNGLLIDPSQKIHSKMDVAISKGKIVEITESIDPKKTEKVLDVTNQIVTPGLIDIHTHVFYLIGHWRDICLDVDETCLKKGVTTVLDVGSPYIEDLPAYRHYIVNQHKTRVYALVYQRASDGPRDLTKGIKENSDFVLGVKYHHEALGTMDMLLLARENADHAGCMLMCEPYGPDLKTILSYLYKEDCLTHSFHPLPRRGLLDEGGKVLKEVRDAVERGVYLDQGHGGGGFGFDVAEKCIKQGLLPWSISTDLHTGNINGPVFDMPTTMSKWLMLGLSLEEVIKRSTLNPAIVLKKEKEIGTLKIGACADITVLRMDEGEFTFVDCARENRIGNKRLTAIHTIRGGEIIF